MLITRLFRSVFARTPNQEGGSCTSARMLWFLSTRSVASLNGSTTRTDCDTSSPNCIRKEVPSMRSPSCEKADKLYQTWKSFRFVFLLLLFCICAFEGVYLSGKELRKLILPKSAPFEEKLRIHKEVLCARHPPIFHEWFLRTFPDPTSWYVLSFFLWWRKKKSCTREPLKS